MRIFQKKQKDVLLELKEQQLPKHLAVIMDGNGRWAQKRHLPRSAGHTAGTANFKALAKYCNKIGIKYMSAYAFSTENWKRSEEEVNALMKLFEQYLKDTIADFEEDNIKVRFIGDTTAFSDNLQELIKQATQICDNKTGMVLNIAMNYGSKAEITRATKHIANLVSQGKMEAKDISEKDIERSLYTAGQPDIDLMIRTSGEYRISNFMLWQLAYAELFITDTLWPDFKEEELNSILLDFSKRNRRFGGV